MEVSFCPSGCFWQYLDTFWLPQFVVEFGEGCYGNWGGSGSQRCCWISLSAQHYYQEWYIIDASSAKVEKPRWTKSAACCSFSPSGTYLKIGYDKEYMLSEVLFKWQCSEVFCFVFQFYCILEKGRKSIKLVCKIRLIYRTCDWYGIGPCSPFPDCCSALMEV